LGAGVTSTNGTSTLLLMGAMRGSISPYTKYGRVSVEMRVLTVRAIATPPERIAGRTAASPRSIVREWIRPHSASPRANLASLIGSVIQRTDRGFSRTGAAR